MGLSQWVYCERGMPPFWKEDYTVLWYFTISHHLNGTRRSRRRGEWVARVLSADTEFSSEDNL